MQVHERLKFDEYGKSMLYIFSSCKDTVRVIPLMMYDEHKPEDLDTDLEDHILDSIRYFCMMRPIAPREVVEAKVPMHDPINQFTKANKYNRAIWR